MFGYVMPGDLSPNLYHVFLIVRAQKARPPVTLRQPPLNDFAFAAIVVHSLHPAIWNVICVRVRRIKNIVPLFENDIRAYRSRTSERAQTHCSEDSAGARSP